MSMNPKVLIVDDKPANLRAMHRILEPVDGIEILKERMKELLEIAPFGL